LFTEKIHPDVILWDYDGTLVDSAKKNIKITKEILKVVAPHLTGNNLPFSLLTEPAYHEANHKAENWQDLYKNFYGLNEAETLQAGSLWTKYQLESKTPVKFFDGIKEVLNELSHVSHGICSQNSSKNILKELKGNDLDKFFKAVIGYDDLAEGEQKPSPKSGILCLEKIFDIIKNKTILYFGDHESDVLFARNLSSELHLSNKVYSAAVTYSGADISNWKVSPDFIFPSPTDITSFFK